MKLSQIGRITQATVLSLAIALGMTACSEDYTIDYLYVTASRAVSSSSPNGSISGYLVDNQSGALTQLADSPYSSGGNDPVGLALSPNNQALYVLNQKDSTIVEFLIGTDGKIYPKNTYNLGPLTTTGTFPTAAVVDPTNTYLIVTFLYQHGFTTASPGPGGVAIFTINSDNSLNPTPVANGALPYFPAGNNPISVGVSPMVSSNWTQTTVYATGTTIFDGTNAETAVTGGTSGAATPAWSKTGGATTTDGTVTWKNGGPTFSYVYVVDQETAGGQVLGFQLTNSTGTTTLTPLTGTTATLTTDTGYAAGVVPHAIAEDPTGRFVYITDQASNQLIGYIVQKTGWLAPMVNGPFSTGQFPQGVTVDPRGAFLYVTNYNSSTVSPFAINQANGTPTGVFSSGSVNTGTGPSCVVIEPSLGIYLYTSNFIDYTVTGLQLDPHTGALAAVQNSPFNAAGNPTCAVAAAAGAHAYPAVQP